MKNLVISLLKHIINGLEEGTTYLDALGCHKVLNTINLMLNGDLEMSKTEAAEYIGVCRATFDNYIKNGYIPRGTSSHKDTKTLFWWKSDLDLFLYKLEQNHIDIHTKN